MKWLTKEFDNIQAAVVFLNTLGLAAYEAKVLTKIPHLRDLNEYFAVSYVVIYPEM